MNSPAAAAVPGRIAVLGALVIDQIAAGEVVERPASVVKELVDNSLDAGATRVDVELEDGGMTRISVRDNGRGIHPDDLILAVTRHATSKLRHAADIADIATLGFRGEALASVAAVARVDLRSRQPAAPVGMHLHNIPGEAPTLTPAGMPVGTQIDVHALFANLPARRKFMRAEATEVGHCSDTLLRLAIVHPGVHFTLRHGKRELLNLPRATREARVAQVLERRVAGPFFVFRGEDDGVRVEAHLPHPNAAGRGRGSPFLITRQRVVRERSLAQIVAQAYGLGGEAPSACLFVEPPAGAVDVNVHPQKAEVRFSDPQQVYAAVRRVLAAAVAAAPWAGELASASASGHVASNMSSATAGAAPAGDGADLSSGTSTPRAAIPPGRTGAIPIGFAPVRGASPLDPRGLTTSDDERAARRARGDADLAPARRTREDELDEDLDDDERDDDGASPRAASRAGLGPDLESGRRAAGEGDLEAGRPGPHDDLDDELQPTRRATRGGLDPHRVRGDELADDRDDELTRGDELDPDDLARRDADGGAPGPAVLRAQRAAAAAAAGRRAEAEAWLTRAEASVDAARRPLTELDRTPASPGRPARATPGAPVRAPAGDPGWDLDLADAPAAGDREAPASGDMSSRAGLVDSRARTRTGAPATDAASDLSPETASDGARLAAVSGRLATATNMSAGPSSQDMSEGSLDPNLSPGTSDLESPRSSDLSLKTSIPDAPRRPDLSPEASSSDRAPSSDLSPGTSAAPRSSDLSPGTSDEAAWLTRAGAESDLPDAAADRAAAWLERAGAEFPPDLRETADPLLRWSELQPDQPPPSPPPASEDKRPGAYRLSTRALDQGYDRHKRAVMAAAAALRPDGGPARPTEPERDDSPALLGLDAPAPRDMREQTGPVGQPATAPRPDVPALLACLPGPVALFADRDALLAVDLRRVRSHLVYLRLQRDLVGRRAVAVQGLLSPAVVQRPAADVALLLAARAELLGLGVDLDVFGDDAVVVRGVPAHLRHCVDDADAADLVARIVPWLRIRSGDGDRAARERGLLDAIAATHGGDPAPRLARRWLAELIDAGAALESVPGIRRWSAEALLGGA